MQYCKISIEYFRNIPSILRCYVGGFSDFQNLWCNRLHIIFGDFNKLYMIRMIFIRFQCDFMRFRTFREDSKLTTTVSTYSILQNFLWLHARFRTKWFNDFTSEWPLKWISNFLLKSRFFGCLKLWIKSEKKKRSKNILSQATDTQIINISHILISHALYWLGAVEYIFLLFWFTEAGQGREEAT